MNLGLRFSFYIAVARFVSCTFPQPARICDPRFLFKLIQIKNIISWRFKNTFHLSPSTSI